MPYKNPEDARVNQRKYREAHKEQARAWRLNNQDKVKKWREENKERQAALAKLYQKTHKRQRKYYPSTSPARNKLRRQKRARMVDEIKQHYSCCNPACAWTGPYHPSLLDFHHVDDTAKLFCVSQHMKVTVSALANEMNKCTVLCANCHRLATWTGLDCSAFRKVCVDDKGKIN